MRSLLDVNVVIALLDVGRSQHESRLPSSAAAGS